MLSILKSFRPKQWTKNLLVFAAPFFSFTTINEIWFSAFIGFISFCLASSSIYLLNDVLDLKNDRNHPSKKYRPIASGAVSTKTALSFSLFLIILSSYLAISVSLSLLYVILIYLIIQIAYCVRLKTEPILDIFCISSGFLLRAIAGVKASDLEFSQWFLLSIGLLALFLAIEKRKAELQISQSLNIKTRKSLERYSISLLKRIEPIVSTSSFMSYSLWAISTSINGVPKNSMILTIPFVLLGIFRYQLITDSEERVRREAIKPNVNPEKPEEILLSDKGILSAIIGWLITIAIIGFS